MSVKRLLKLSYLSHFSKPASDRPIYRAIRRHRVGHILEFGVGIGQRAQRMLELASLVSPSKPLRYVGVDLFEDRTAADGPGVSLKMAHRLLNRTGARIQLRPGDPLQVLARLANSLVGTDLVVISARQNRESLARAWFYLPRILHADSQVFLEKTLPAGGLSMRLVGPEEITELAAAAPRRAA